MKMNEIKILVRGGGDLATGVAYRLKKVGFPVIVTELAEPLVVRRTVSLAEAVFSGELTFEGMQGIRTKELETAVELAYKTEVIPVLIDPDGQIMDYFQPTVVIDGTMNKRNALGTNKEQARVVIGLGPGFSAGKDVHAVVETKRGHYLGRVIYDGPAAKNTGIPGIVEGKGLERVVYAPKTGIFTSERDFGEVIEAGEIFGWIDETPVHAAISGVIRGILKPGITIKEGVKIGDIDPRKEKDFSYTISDKALAIAGGVLEAILFLLHNTDDKKEMEANEYEESTC